MRRGALLLVVSGLVLVAFLLHSVSTLLSLLFEDASADAIHRTELPLLNSSTTAYRPQVIPKIIHQTYKNESIPEAWKEAQESCIALHPDYQYILWTNEMARNFIAKEYPWFLSTFDSYEFPIQRADTIRYFILAHYGGTYIDLDDGCNRRLDPLLSYPAWVRRTAPTGISNDAMGSIPQHPFFLSVIKRLQSYNRSWLLPYITVMYSTGPLFLSVIWKEYMHDHPNEGARVRVLMPNEYNKHPQSFFTHHVGNSWHGRDAKIVFWMGDHWVLLTVCGFILATAVGCSIWSIYDRLATWTSQSRHRYLKVPILTSRGSSPMGRAQGMMPTLFQRVSFKEDEESRAVTETSYEVYDRFD